MTYFLKIEDTPVIQLSGFFEEMNFVNDKTPQLWKNFRKTLKVIMPQKQTDMYSVQFYPDKFFTAFNPETNFTKWAAVPTTVLENIPDTFKNFVIPGGKYAVFHHKGGSVTAQQAFAYIFTEWLPNSGYLTDNRPHFEVLGEKYDIFNQPDSEEEIWIPVRAKV